jgi:hypothetical protein
MEYLYENDWSKIRYRSVDGERGMYEGEGRDLALQKDEREKRRKKRDIILIFFFFFFFFNTYFLLSEFDKQLISASTKGWDTWVDIRRPCVKISRVNPGHWAWYSPFILLFSPYPSCSSCCLISIYSSPPLSLSWV